MITKAGKFFFATFIIVLFVCCTKTVNNSGGGDNGGNNPPPDDSTVTVVTPQDPETAPTIGFFMNDWQAKTFSAPSATDGVVPASSTTTITVDASTVVTKIPTTLFGTNANSWMGDFTDAAIVSNITDQNPHIIRFPGGSISDVYFWNSPNGTKPSDAPDMLMNADGTSVSAGYWYGTNTDNWTCSVDKYYSMLQQTKNEGMITVNYGYARYGLSADPVAAAAHLAADWVRYDKGRTKYWEIGNEDAGSWEAGYRINTANNKDGQPEYITGDLYGKHVKVFADSMRNAAKEVGATIYIGAQLIEHTPQGWEPQATQTWNATLIPQVNTVADFYIVHNYYTPYNTNSSAADILSSAVSSSQSVMSVLSQSLTNAAGSTKPVALTEWNIFATGSQQMVSHVAGMHAVMVIGELLKNKYGMAGRWDLANGWSNGDDMGLYNQGDEPGAPKWNPRPAFYYLYYFKKFLGDRYINSSVTGGSGLYTYASTFSSGQIGLTIVNTSTTAQDASFKFKNFNAGNKFYWYSLTGDGAEFSRKVYVNGDGPSAVSGGPSDYATLKPFAASASGGLRLSIPARGVVCVLFDKK